MALMEIIRYQKLHVQDVKMSLAPENWQNLPLQVFGDIMIMIGKERIQDFTKCRQVCHSWNVMMSQMTKYEKDTIRREAESLAAKIREKLWSYIHRPLLPEITTAASLAHHGMLGSVRSLSLCDVDLASVPAEQLASLASCVARRINIHNVSNCDIVSLLYSLECGFRQTLNIEETRALVQAMESDKWIEINKK